MSGLDTLAFSDKCAQRIIVHAWCMALHAMYDVGWGTLYTVDTCLATISISDTQGRGIWQALWRNPPSGIRQSGAKFFKSHMFSHAPNQSNRKPPAYNYRHVEHCFKHANIQCFGIQHHVYVLHHPMFCACILEVLRKVTPLMVGP
jgi:hypothetical protein